MADEYLVTRRRHCYDCKGTGSKASRWNPTMLTKCPRCQGTGKQEHFISLGRALEELRLVVLPVGEALERSVQQAEAERGGAE